MLIELLSTDVSDVDVAGLVGLLLDAVASGASVGFLESLTRDEADAWWRAALADPESRTWVARDATGQTVGTVRLLPAGMPNGRHRAGVAKLLVHRDARGQGCAAGLMAALEDHARMLDRTLLVLDTETGSPAEGIYERWGWQRNGNIPDFAASPNGQLAATTLFSKRL